MKKCKTDPVERIRKAENAIILAWHRREKSLDEKDKNKLQAKLLRLGAEIYKMGKGVVV